MLNFGASVQLIAVSSLLIKVTGSGTVTGFSIVCAPLPGIIFSLFGGKIGDKFRAKRLLVAFDVARGLTVSLFIFCKSVVTALVLLLILSIIETLYYPSKNKIIAMILKKDDLVSGNALLSGGIGAVNLLTPVLAGIAVSFLGVNAAFLAIGASYLLSAAFLSCIKTKYFKNRTVKTGSRKSDAAESFRICFNNKLLRKVILTAAVIDYCTIAVNIAFYSFAFDYMKVSSGYWGAYLSILYGMNIVSMLILMRYKSFFRKKEIASINVLLFCLSAVWLFYSAMQSRIFVLAAGAVEGICNSLCVTLITTCILENSKKGYTARIFGVQYVLSSFAKLLGAVFTYTLLRRFSFRFIFISSAAIIAAYAFCAILTPAEKLSDQAAK